MKIECDVDFLENEDDSGRMVKSVLATCPKCGHTTESFGHGEPSIKRCFALLGEECPNKENNFYVLGR